MKNGSKQRRFRRIRAWIARSMRSQKWEIDASVTSRADVQNALVMPVTTVLVTHE